jgi:2-keto-4-pentenoate hydratase/2-oxohepta-3-ene-1,7-dioic acid hydratase in catechol pathway
MKLLRYVDPDGEIHFAEQISESEILRLGGNPFAHLRSTGESARIRKVLAPIDPATILCIGLNYKHHAAESGMKVPEHPILFMKSPNTVLPPDDPIQIPVSLASHEVDYECELAVVIGRTCKNVGRERALEYVLGYTCANDVSARDWQIKHGGGQWCRGKCFDTFLPLGPALVTADEIPNPNKLAIKTVLNGETVQDWNTNDMIFDVSMLIEFLSGSTTLLPGTVILTGTPHGVGMAAKPPRWLKQGDKVTVEIEKIGRLTNPVAREP